MIISHLHRFIFLKTRKVAGSSLEKILDRYLGPHDISTGSQRDGTPARNQGHTMPPHADSAWIQERFPVEWRSYYKFTIVRNPWDCMVSFYFFHRAIEPHKQIFAKDFNHFIRHARLSDWNDWYRYTKNSEICVDTVLKFESLHNHLLIDTNIPYQL